MDPELLSMLCSPDTRTSLEEASEDFISELNADIAKGLVKTAAGVLVTEALKEGLISADKSKLYPVKEGIPVLLSDEAILLTA
ncbi:MAG: hypothetical protein M0P13_07860 [Fibrobacteraceae bacterium]|nr:hypothetical protein [Fibrobacteraceae bacterium]